MSKQKSTKKSSVAAKKSVEQNNGSEGVTDAPSRAMRNTPSQAPNKGQNERSLVNPPSV